jgi:lysine 6-dehydrogenase
MRVIVLGCGNIGSVIARDLCTSMPSWEVVVADRDAARTENVRSTIKANNVTAVTLDASDGSRMGTLLTDCDLAVSALPGWTGYQAVESCIKAGLDVVDVSYMPEDPYVLEKAALNSGITFIPDCGVAPGLSNFLVGRAASQLDSAHEAHILVGGLPKAPMPPLEYTITWSVDGLIDEYTRKAKIKADGRIKEVEALSGLEEVEFPGVGKLEAFYSDGARTLLRTMKGFDSLWEKTLRYPGHAKKVKFLRDMGFFDEGQMEVDGLRIIPRRVTSKLLESKLRTPEVDDILAMMVNVTGTKQGKTTHLRYLLLDRCDRSSKVTAMARTTGFTASVTAQLLGRNDIRRKGLVTPEELGADVDIYGKIMADLRKRKVVVEEMERSDSDL